MLKNNKDWYGLFVNNELSTIKSFTHEPSIMDFKSYYNSNYTYDVRPLNITIITGY